MSEFSILSPTASANGSPYIAGFHYQQNDLSTFESYSHGRKFAPTQEYGFPPETVTLVQYQDNGSQVHTDNYAAPIDSMSYQPRWTSNQQEEILSSGPVESSGYWPNNPDDYNTNYQQPSLPFSGYLRNYSETSNVTQPTWTSNQQPEIFLNGPIQSTGYPPNGPEYSAVTHNTQTILAVGQQHFGFQNYDPANHSMSHQPSLTSNQQRQINTNGPIGSFGYLPENYPEAHNQQFSADGHRSFGSENYGQPNNFTGHQQSLTLNQNVESFSNGSGYPPNYPVSNTVAQDNQPLSTEIQQQFGAVQNVQNQKNALDAKIIKRIKNKISCSTSKDKTRQLEISVYDLLVDCYSAYDPHLATRCNDLSKIMQKKITKRRPQTSESSSDSNKKACKRNREKKKIWFDDAKVLFDRYLSYQSISSIEFRNLIERTPDCFKSTKVLPQSNSLFWISRNSVDNNEREWE